MTWKRLDLSPDAAATFKTAFAQAFEHGNRPRNAALFEVVAENRVQLYFSPGGAELFEATLRALAKKNAGAPPPGAKLVVGDAVTWGHG